MSGPDKPLTDDLGEAVPLRGAPTRVVSLVPSLTEAVELTLPGIVAGATDYCTHPDALAAPRVGGSKYPDVDAVLELAPDLVLANAEENRKEDVERLRGQGVPVWVMAAPATVPSALRSLRALFTGILGTGAPDWLVTAEELWRESRSPAMTAVVPVWRKPWVVLGRDTFGGDVLRRLGVRHAYSADDERYPRPKIGELRELFAAGKADVLVLPDEPWEFTADDGPDAFPGVPYTLVSGRYLTWYGPSLVEAHQALSAALTTVTREVRSAR
ncbi:cobalamin-binding protein [Prauserella marina]|uniref:ABC-type Fe3+-hydroxamate transport system, substrate-binding protein n=1 Tax=Prauserella marina TaxID=530584 RepID=A0A222VKD8_9PSEU|nr:helical backbone metal receptor [Prauserella marina]ASR34390.1 cobalamin-binding protein [Prauserella marina]PWV70569.1 ABC-type Fe3+-hydroxamate transport system substrate-binding protein [Prauserella marina]SDE02927.1 ABC-type Fe3+-hydroxamate transport system, substrate-binding protein [Prauserella marina]